MKYTKNLVSTALFTAVICVVSPFAIQIGDIPLSFGTLAIYIAAASLGWKFGTLSVIVYILLGAVGMPVFTGFTGGLFKLVGLTGGYIFGYIFLALIAGLTVDLTDGKRWSYPIGMVAGTILLYIFGTIWYIIQSGAPLPAALGMCVVPFLPGDCAKIIVASSISPVIRRMTEKHIQKA